MQAWNVYRNSKLIDTVFFDKNCNRDYVWRSLVDHDGYDITFIRRNNKLGI